MTVDLLTALQEIEERARHTQQLLTAGLAANGSTSLRRIEHMAADARRHHQVCDENERKAGSK